MTSPIPLVADAVIGHDVRNCLLLASHPQERMQPNGWEPSHTRRTFVLFFDGHVARTGITLPDPLVRAWTSGTGVGYAAPVRGNYLYVYAAGKWKREQFSEKDEWIACIWGLTGADGAGDTVFMSTESGLFIRHDKQWTLHTPPAPAKKVYGVHGLSTDEVYVCGDQGLLRWNGRALEAINGPSGPLPQSIVVLPDEVIAGGDILSHWTDGEGWRKFEPAINDVMALSESRGRLLVGTYAKGVFERQGESVRAATPPFACLALHQMGSDAIACGDEQGFVSLDGQWQPLSLPVCAAGQMPADTAP